MFPSPYRNPSRLARTGRLGQWSIEDGAVMTVLGLFWAVSVVRVAGDVMQHEVLGAEATLALLAVLAVPWLIWGRPRRSLADNSAPPKRCRTQ